MTELSDAGCSLLQPGGSQGSERQADRGVTGSCQEGQSQLSASALGRSSPRSSEFQFLPPPPFTATMVIMPISLCHSGLCVDVCAHSCMWSLKNIVHVCVCVCVCLGAVTDKALIVSIHGR